MAKTWDDIFEKYVAKGQDYSSAAFMADQWEGRQETIASHKYYSSCLYGNWSVFRDGIQFASDFRSEEAAKEFISRIVTSAKQG